MADERFRRAIRVITDFRPGIPIFDAAPLLADSDLFAEAIDNLAMPYTKAGIDIVIGVEARGFYYASPVAVRLHAGFVPARKPDKLPGSILTTKALVADDVGVVGAGGEKTSAINGLATYSKAYEFEIQTGTIFSGARVLVVDDLLAKGGSALACCQLAEQCGASIVGCAFLIELAGLGGARLLAPRPVHTLIPINEV